MAKEIERKFLVKDNSYRRLAFKSVDIVQGYLSVIPKATVRVRIRGSEAFLTVKGINKGAERSEWEYPIPVEEALAMLRECAVSKVIEKTRYVVPGDDGLLWEIDEFHGVHNGLVLAEIEIPAADYHISIPPYIGEEVTGNPLYYNSTLASV